MKNAADNLRDTILYVINLPGGCEAVCDPTFCIVEETVNTYNVSAEVQSKSTEFIEGLYLNYYYLYYYENESYFEDIVTYENKLNDREVKVWLQYINNIKMYSFELTLIIFIRAINKFNNSYKLWKRLLEFILNEGKKYLEYTALFDHIFELSSYTEYTFPKIAIMKADYYNIIHNDVKECKKIYDKAIIMIPLTQHKSILWPKYIKFVDSITDIKLKLCVYERYIIIDNEMINSFLQIIYENLDNTSINFYLNRDSLSAIIMNHIESVDEKTFTICVLILIKLENSFVQSIINYGIKKFTSITLDCYLLLAKLYANSFETVELIFEKALNNVRGVNQFEQIFNSYIRYIKEYSDNISENNEKLNIRNLYEEKILTLLKNKKTRLDRIKLESNKDDTLEWIKYALNVGNQRKIEKYNDKSIYIAIKSVFEAAYQYLQPSASYSYLIFLFEYASLIELNDSVENVELLFESFFKILPNNIKYQLGLWRGYIEFLIRSTTIDIVSQSLTNCLDRYISNGKNEITYRELWNLKLDIEMSYKTLDAYLSTFIRMINIQVATIDIINDFIQILIENKMYDKLFRILERIIQNYKGKIIDSVYIIYLSLFISRYGNVYIEPIRYMFDDALIATTNNSVYKVYYLYAQFEFNFGLISKGFDILLKSLKVLDGPNLDIIINIYAYNLIYYHGIKVAIKKFKQLIEITSINNIIKLGNVYIACELLLKNFSNARKIYSYIINKLYLVYKNNQILSYNKQTIVEVTASSKKQLEDWNKFELDYGNENTYLDYLDLSNKFNVELKYIDDNYLSLNK